MNPTLMEAVLELAAFLYVNIDVHREATTIDGRVAMKELEWLQSHLDQLSSEDRLAFADHVMKVAAREEEAAKQAAPFYTRWQNPEYREFLQSFADDLRDNDEE